MRIDSSIVFELESGSGAARRNARFSEPRRRVCVGLIAAALCMGPAAAVRAADSPLGELLEFFFGGDEQANMQPAVVAVQVGAGGEFRQPLLRLLLRELHFARKVCQPNDDQFAQIRKAGFASIADLATQFAVAQANGKGSNDWPEPRRKLQNALHHQMQQVLPAEAAQRYREEIDARAALQSNAAQQMMTTVIDRRLDLLPEQFDAVQKQLAENWNKRDDRNLQVYLYSEYLVMPDESVLAPALNERQRKLYRTGDTHGSISFGWEQDLGLNWSGENGGEVDAFGTLGDHPGLKDSSVLLQQLVEPAPAAAGAAASPAAEAVPADAPEPDKNKGQAGGDSEPAAGEAK